MARAPPATTIRSVPATRWRSLEAVAIDRSLEEAGVSVVLEDDALIVLDKPPGLLTVATDAEKTDTAFAWLSAHLTARKLGRPFVVHRLDRETSGLLLFARSCRGAIALQANWPGSAEDLPGGSGRQAVAGGGGRGQPPGGRARLARSRCPQRQRRAPGGDALSHPRHPGAAYSP